MHHLNSPAFVFRFCLRSIAVSETFRGASGYCIRFSPSSFRRIRRDRPDLTFDPYPAECVTDHWLVFQPRRVLVTVDPR